MEKGETSEQGIITKQMMRRLFGESPDHDDALSHSHLPIRSTKGIVISVQENQEDGQAKSKDVGGGGDVEGKGKGIMTDEHEREQEDEHEWGQKGSYPTVDISDAFADSQLGSKQYSAPDENSSLQGKKSKDKPAGPPLLIELPPRPRPPNKLGQMRLIKISNIIYIDPEPFDAETYFFDETELTKRINVVRWRKVQNPDGTIARETNSRFVRWSDGSLQLFIGSEALDVTEQEAEDLQTHLYLRVGMGLMVAQGRILYKMMVMPSSLSSESHRSLTALVGSQSKKVSKVKSYVASVDPEWELEEMRKAAAQAAKANAVLQRKQEKVIQKHEKNSGKKKKKKGEELSVDMLENSASDEVGHE